MLNIIRTAVRKAVDLLKRAVCALAALIDMLIAVRQAEADVPSPPPAARRLSEQAERVLEGFDISPEAKRELRDEMLLRQDPPEHLRLAVEIQEHLLDEQLVRNGRPMPDHWPAAVKSWIHFLNDDTRRKVISTHSEALAEHLAGGKRLPFAPVYPLPSVSRRAPDEAVRHSPAAAPADVDDLRVSYAL